MREEITREKPDPPIPNRIQDKVAVSCAFDIWIETAYFW
jgi:hypothetical protein